MKKNRVSLRGCAAGRLRFEYHVEWARRTELLQSRRYDVLLVSTYLPDLYVGDFFERLRRLPVQPCTIVMQEDHDSASMVQNVRYMIGERKTSDTMKAAGCDRPNDLV